MKKNMMKTKRKTKARKPVVRKLSPEEEKQAIEKLLREYVGDY